MTRLRILCVCLATLLSAGACRQSPVPGAATGATPPEASAAKPASVAIAEADSGGDAAGAPAPSTAVPAWEPAIPEITEAQVPRTLQQARKALALGQVERGTSPGPGALELFLAVRKIAPGNPDAESGLRSVLDAMFERGRIALRGGDLARAETIDAIAEAVMPAHPDRAVYRQRLDAAHRAQALLAQGEAMARRGNLMAPAGRSAFDLFRRAEQEAPDFAPVAASRQRWHRQLLQSAWRAASDEDYALAEQRLALARQWLPDSAENEVMDLRVMELRQALTDALLAQGNAAVDRMELDQAERSLEHASRVAAQAQGPEALRERIHLAHHYGPFQPLHFFAEELAAGGRGPEMVVLPYGRFRMGSPPDEPGRASNEGPAHEVVFERGFALARSETTVAQFRRFVEATGYRTLAERQGRSTVYDERGGQMSERQGVDWRSDQAGRRARPQQPVVHVAFSDAQAYAQWLSEQTGETYRLPTEAEFEYALRAGSDRTYPWGLYGPTRLVGNLAGEGDQSPKGRRWGNAVPGYRDGFWGPAPVRSFPAENFATFDLVGNVAEWTLDCWHDSYQRAPADGSAWINPGCGERVVRGASWASSLDQARSAYRVGQAEDNRGARVGFRVVRVL